MLRFLFSLLILLWPAAGFAQSKLALAQNKRLPPSSFQLPNGYFNRISVPKNAAVYMFDVESGNEFYSRSADVPLKPASVLKILTSMAALDRYGPYYQIRTEVLATGVAGTHLDTLYVRGHGDPKMTQENLWLIARKIYLRGVRSIGNLIVDDSMFIDPASRSGQRAYQAGASALSLNFNSLTFEVCPIGGQKHATVTHDPREVPVRYTGAISVTSRGSSTFNLDEVKASRSAFPLQYKLGGRISTRSGCQAVYRSVADPALYFGYTLRGLLEREGIRIGRGVRRGVAPRGAAVVYTYRSEPLHQATRALNTYSNNMIADQLVMLVGKRADGKYERSEGLARLGQFLMKRGASPNDFSIHDGSGLSHQNRITARALGGVLREALSSEELGVEFESSLPVDGKSGTLRKRAYAGTIRAKTGTLNGVRSLAGGVRSLQGRRVGFVILQNKVSSGAKASKLEKTVIELLRKLPV